MSGTIKFNQDFAVENGNFSVGPTYTRSSLTQTAQGGPNPGTVTVTTTAAAITTGITTLGLCRVTNLDTTNYVEIGPYVSGTLHSFIKLEVGDPPWTFRLLPGVYIGAKANTASCKVNFEVYEK